MKFKEIKHLSDDKAPSYNKLKDLFLFFNLIITGYWVAPQSLAFEKEAYPVVQASAEMLERLHIQPVNKSDVSQTLRLPGRVTLDEHLVARIGPSISGRVAEIKAFIGRQVQKGETLAVLNSTELSNAQAAFLKAKTQMGLHKLAVDRARRLFNEGIISEATLKEREGGLAEAEVEMSAMTDQLGVMGMNASTIQRLANTGHINSITPISATLTGTVIERHLSMGQIVEISDELFTVADLSRLWVIAEAPEQDAHNVDMGMLAEVRIPALQNEKFDGKVIYVADTVKPTTRTITVRMEVLNPRRKIKPEMLADMVIRKQTVNALIIPAQAVVREADQDHVYVRTGTDQFELRPVILGEDRNGERQVLSGLTGKEKIVIDGAFHLNNLRVLRDLE